MDIVIGIFCVQFGFLFFLLLVGRKNADKLAGANNQLIDDVIEEMCDGYCKYPMICTQEKLDEHCDNCPLNELNKIRS